MATMKEPRAPKDTRALTSDWATERPNRVHCDVNDEAYANLQERARRNGRSARRQASFDLQDFLLSPEVRKLAKVS